MEHSEQPVARVMGIKSFDIETPDGTKEVNVKIVKLEEPPKKLDITRQTFNSKIYGTYVEPIVDNLNDYYWLCNQLGKLYQGVNDGCVDNFRLERTESKECWSPNYSAAVDDGCCASIDKLGINAITGNMFWFGFNYGH